MRTNFENVCVFNDLIGNDQGDYHNIDWDRLERQRKLIEEEFNELKDAIKSKDIIEVRDAVADILVTTYGLAHCGGFNADEDMDEVNESNLSKFCGVSTEASATERKYKDLGVEVTFRHRDIWIAVVSAKDQTGTDGKFYPAGKLLKSINFVEPEFTDPEEDEVFF